jgi:hypothetical protein
MRQVRVNRRTQPPDNVFLQLAGPQPPLLPHADEAAEGAGRQCAQIELGVLVGYDFEHEQQNASSGSDSVESPLHGFSRMRQLNRYLNSRPSPSWCSSSSHLVFNCSS